MESKLNFKDLEYIVMEGAGARGVAYLGAVIALEKLMEKRMKDSKDTIKVKVLANGRSAGLMDYYTLNEKGEEVPVIKGIAGSSAGAITAYALSLGLNSDEIAIILDYPFDNFLKEKDVGKYRMIDENNDLAIGEDGKREDVGSKQLGNKVKKFEFAFSENETKVGGNPAKLVVRNAIFTLIFKVIFDGLRTQVSQANDNNLYRLVNIRDNDDVGPFGRFLKFVKNFFSGGFAAQKAWNAFLFKFFVPYILKAPIKKLDIDAVGNVLFDRGMFSGFAIREFFMDMTLYAATRDTHFHRRSIIIYKENEGANEEKTKKALLELLNFKIGGRKDSKIDDTNISKEYLKLISNMDFMLFQKITKTNFGVCVASLSTGNPLYFGAEWTPDFRVMEAVASSMTIPPAVKALYNASDVVKSEVSKTINININGRLTSFVDSRGIFSESDYYLYEYVVKKALQEELLEESETDRAYIDLNNSLEVNAFLPKLQELVVGKFEKERNEFINSQGIYNRTVFIGGNSYKVDYKLLQFFYNAVYKGLFIDGGYRINIPYNFYRLRNDSINTVLAIKIDENFPPTLLKSVYDALITRVSIIELETYFSQDEYLDNSGIDEFELLSAVGPYNKEEIVKRRKVKAIIREETKKVFYRYLSDKKLSSKEIRKSDRVIKKIAKTAFKRYRNSKNTKPWATPISVLSTAFDGFYYGAERGQIKQISDHNQIIPLYDYGVGTYDFDLKKVKPQAEAAKEEAEKQVLTFFNYDNNQ